MATTITVGKVYEVRAYNAARNTLETTTARVTDYLKTADGQRFVMVVIRGKTRRLLVGTFKSMII